MYARLFKIAIIACILFTVLSAHASPIRIDPLAHTDPFHFVFVTSGTRNASSGDIDDYNQFVQDAADAVGIGTSIGLTWRAIISTATVDAIDNVAITGPVYTLDDRLVANDANDMFDGSIANPINYDEMANVNVKSNVWTGSRWWGKGHIILPSNYYYAGNGATVTLGYAEFATDWWIQGHPEHHSTDYALFAVSSPLTVGLNPVPIPPGILLMASGLIGCAGLQRWFRR